MIETDLPDNLSSPTGLPHGTSRHLGEVSALHAMVCMGSVDVAPFLGGITSPRSAPSEATSIGHRGKARCPPRVMAVDVVLRVAAITDDKSIKTSLM